MSYETYKLIHMFGIMCLFTGFGIIATLAFTGQLASKIRGMGFGLHGLGLLLMIFSGFGMAARLQIFQHLPGWLYGKVVIWLIMGGIIALFRRKPKFTAYNLALVLALGVGAGYLALFKPF